MKSTWHAGAPCHGCRQSAPKLTCGEHVECSPPFRFTAHVPKLGETAPGLRRLPAWLIALGKVPSLDHEGLFLLLADERVAHLEDAGLNETTHRHAVHAQSHLQPQSLSDLAPGEFMNIPQSKVQNMTACQSPSRSLEIQSSTITILMSSKQCNSFMQVDVLGGPVPFDDQKSSSIQIANAVAWLGHQICSTTWFGQMVREQTESCCSPRRLWRCQSRG